MEELEHFFIDMFGRVFQVGGCHVGQSLLIRTVLDHGGYHIGASRHQAGR
jgi:hypothetical protein